MMAIDPTADGSETFLPIDGALYSAPLGTTLPANATAALDAAFTGHGLWTSDGLSESSDISTTEVRAFQNNVLVGNVVTGGTATITVALLQKNAANKGLYYGDTVDAATGRVRWRPGIPSGDRVFVIDKVDANGEVERIVIERGNARADGDRTTVQGSASAYPIAISILDDSAVIYDTALVTTP
jgi:hypothetical protein